MTTIPTYRYRPPYARFSVISKAPDMNFVADRLGKLAGEHFARYTDASHEAMRLNRLHAPLDYDEREFVRDYAELVAGWEDRAVTLLRGAKYFASPDRLDRLVAIADRYNRIYHEIGR